MFKKILFQIHWFLGITAGIILAIIGVTGAIYSYDQQILNWLNTESYQVIVPENQEKLTPEQLYQHFIQQDNQIQINSIRIAQEANASSTINIAKEGARRGKNILVNPYTAEVLPEIKGQEFFQFIQRLHRYLTLGDFGKQVTGAVTLMLFYFVLSGLYLRIPKKHSLRQWFFIKPKLKGRNFIWDLHAVVGTWVVVFYLIFAVTGLYWSYDWWRSGMFKVLGVEQPQQQNQANSKKDNPRAEGRGRGAEKQEHLSSAEISYALAQTWTGFHQQVKRDYSSITLTLPKTNDGKLELSFVDVPAQHERARNTANYDYQKHQIEKLELYEEKGLNEKIMSSMLPVHRGSFMGPVYQFFAMLASLAMPLFLITGIMLYLKRRKQKKLTQLARHSHQTKLVSDAEKWTILYASQTGMAEQIAYNTSLSLQNAGIPTQVQALKNCTPAQIRDYKQVLFVVSTYGTGEAPDLAINFVKKYLSNPQNLAGLHYAVLALGSKEYPETYCTFGHQLNTWLAASQAQELFPLHEVDNGNTVDLERWYASLAQLTEQQVTAVIEEKSFTEWQLTARHLLNAHSLGEPVFEIVLQSTTKQTWQAGDILEIKAANTIARIDAFIKKYHLKHDLATVQALTYKDLSLDFMAGNSLALHADLPTREYSIANIPSENSLKLIVRQKQIGEDFGLGSGWLTHHAALKQPILAHIRHNPSFHLIEDARPIILIGNGTGIAGLMGLLKQRKQLGFNANWLIFGERQESIDFFYREQLLTWQKEGFLTHLDTAFSRDQEQRVYVQDKLLQQRERVQNWILERNAVIYVCGSIDGMANGVEQALIDILGETKLDQLRQDNRYRRDVY